MDIRFKGASLPYYERILNTAVSQEDTAETIIPDALPDVAELLMTDGQSLIRGKDVHRSGVSVSGISELNVLYRTEEGGIGRLPVEIPGRQPALPAQLPADQQLIDRVADMRKRKT